MIAGDRARGVKDGSRQADARTADSKYRGIVEPNLISLQVLGTNPDIRMRGKPRVSQVERLGHQMAEPGHPTKYGAGEIGLALELHASKVRVPIELGPREAARPEA